MLRRTPIRSTDPADHVTARLPDRPADPDSCWLWQGTLNSRGYGVCQIGGRQRKAHVITYEVLHGPVPAGLELDHLCKNPQCCRPSHLEPVTGRENLLRSDNPCAINARKTHCDAGHEFTPENTRERKSGGRTCVTCMRAYQAAWRARQRTP